MRRATTASSPSATAGATRRTPPPTVTLIGASPERAARMRWRTACVSSAVPQATRSSRVSYCASRSSDLPVPCRTSATAARVAPTNSPTALSPGVARTKSSRLWRVRFISPVVWCRSRSRVSSSEPGVASSSRRSTRPRTPKRGFATSCATSAASRPSAASRASGTRSRSASARRSSGNASTDDKRPSRPCTSESMTDQITCVVADDHPAVLSSVADLLARSGFEVLGRARDGAEALALIETERPHVALVDVRMPRMSGIEVAERASVTTPDTAIVFYTAFGDRALLSEALDVGVRGFVLKEAPLVDLVRAVERVAAGDAYVDPVLAGVLVSGHLTDRAPSLTQRERETLRLLADGLSNEEIGKELHISPETVRTHVRKAMAKLEADTRTQAVATALRQSIIS